MKISENFNLEEFIVSATAVEKGIRNVPNPEQIVNIKRLVQTILQPVRKRMGMPIIVSSGFRCAELNRLVGGSPTSQHCIGEAADMKCADNALLFETIRKNFVFDQLIWEFGNNSAPDWVHVSMREKNNRCEALQTVNENGKTKYLRL